MIPRDELGECLHTALRKLCDSKATSIAWNIIYMLPKEGWINYLDWVYSQMKSGKSLKEASLGWNGWYGNGATVCLKLSFELFSDEDWQNYGIYLTEEEQDGKVSQEASGD